MAKMRPGVKLVPYTRKPETAGEEQQVEATTSAVFNHLICGLDNVMLAQLYAAVEGEMSRRMEKARAE